MIEIDWVSDFISTLEGEGDPPEVLLRSSKLKIEGITLDELAKKLSSELEKLI